MGTKHDQNQAGEITRTAVPELASQTSQQCPVVPVENVDAPDNGNAGFMTIADALFQSNGKPPLAPVFTSGPFLRLPRPDRLLVRPRFQHQTASDGNQGLDEILAAWNLQLNGPARRAGSPGRSRNWLIPTSEGLKVLKRYKPSLDRDWVIHEHSILQALAATSFPAPQLIPAAESTLIERDGRIFALFEAYEGYFQYHNSIFLPGMAQQFVSIAGKTLATLHLALRGCTPHGCNPNGFMSISGGRWRELDWYFSRLERCAATLPAVSSLIARHPFRSNASGRQSITAAWLRQRLEVLDKTLKRARLERVIAHGDYGPYNLLFRQGYPVVVLDFELARLDWRLTDLSSGLFYFTHGWTGFHWEKMHWFLDTYRSVAPVSADEMQYLPLVWQFLTLRRIIVLLEQSQDGNPGAIQETQKRLNLLNWLIRHEEELRRL